MGNKLKQSGIFSKTAMSQIGTVSICPNCQQNFPPSTTYENFDQHVTQCLQNFRPSDQERLRMQRRKKSKDSIGSKESEDDEDNHDYVTIEVYVKKMQSDGKKESENKIREGNDNKSKKKYFWIKSHLTYSQSLLNSLKLEQIRKQGSAYKMLWLHQKLSAMKVTWKKGAEMLTFHPDTIVRDSLVLRNINLYKQLKVTVINDVVHDAGGLLREWAAMLLKQLIQEYRLFIPNKEGYYILNPQFSSIQKLNSQLPQKTPQKQLKQPTQQNQEPRRHSKLQQQLEYYKKMYFDNFENEQQWQDVQDYGPQFVNQYQTPTQTKPRYEDYSKTTYCHLYELFACLLAKIVIEKVTVPISFDWVFVGGLLRRDDCETGLEKLETYDKQIYESIVYMNQLLASLKDTKSPQYPQKLQQLKSLSLTFSIPATTSLPQHQLIPNGKIIPIQTPQQLDKYIHRTIQYYFHTLPSQQLKIVKQKFYSIIKTEYFDGLLQCEEFELLTNGVNGENISIKDWQDGTEYKEPYHKDHKVIKYFWATLQKMTGAQKMRLLKFVTGSERLPVYGFKNLQTNRGQTSCFVIEAVKYDKKLNYLPKAHTCFNRLVLPMYPSQGALAECLLGVVRGSFDGVWGME